ncbi:MAG TPA: adenosylcobinamide-phosphate synthase CbiB [Rubrobacteraceae bacterium]|nr:adenosylcobinamide-phosphate synthase CbiB [Rubrobacteraceae bacterium]
MRPHRGRVVAAALLLDALFGEPPEALHPTVMMGRAISAVERSALEGSIPRRLAGGALAVSLPALVFVATRALVSATPSSWRGAMEAALISTTLSMRGLAGAAVPVESALRAGDLEVARGRVGHFVGRDTAHLSAADAARAAIESVAENTSDAVVAPMLYGVAFGAPGALAYKAVNTLDSMVGYKAEPYARLGWASARLDDLANLVPARATVLAVAAASGKPRATLRSAWRYGPLTASPNAGRVEAAFAGALGVRLGGTNSYGGVSREGPVLGDGRRPRPEDIGRSVALMRRCCLIIVGVSLVLRSGGGPGG